MTALAAPTASSSAPTHQPIGPTRSNSTRMMA